MNYRDGEKPSARYRAENRCFQMNGQWYFATREGIDVGPYESRDAAAFALKRLITLVRDMTDPDARRALVQRYADLKGDLFEFRR